MVIYKCGTYEEEITMGFSHWIHKNGEYHNHNAVFVPVELDLRSTYEYYDSKVEGVNKAQFDSTTQLQILIQIGNKLGLYDATDILRNYLLPI